MGVLVCRCMGRSLRASQMAPSTLFGVLLSVICRCLPWLAGQEAFRGSHISTPLISLYLSNPVRHVPHRPSHVVAGNLNSGQHACASSTLPMATSLASHPAFSCHDFDHCGDHVDVKATCPPPPPPPRAQVWDSRGGVVGGGALPFVC